MDDFRPPTLDGAKMFDAQRELRLETTRGLFLHALPPVGRSRSSRLTDAPLDEVRALREPDLNTILATLDRIDPKLMIKLTEKLHTLYQAADQRKQWRSLLQDTLELVVTAERLRRIEAGEVTIPLGTAIADTALSPDELARPIEERIVLQNQQATTLVTLGRLAHLPPQQTPAEEVHVLTDRANEVCKLRDQALLQQHEPTTERAYLEAKLAFERDFLRLQFNLPIDTTQH